MGRFLWEDFLGGIFVYIGIDLSKFLFLSRFCLKAEGRKEGRKKKISIFRSASASISHIKKVKKKV